MKIIANSTFAILLREELTPAQTDEMFQLLAVHFDGAHAYVTNTGDGSVAVMPGDARTQALPPLRSVAQVELLELLGLSARAAEMVQRTATANKLTHREVIQRVLEQWARSMVK